MGYSRTSSLQPDHLNVKGPDGISLFLQHVLGVPQGFPLTGYGQNSPPGRDKVTNSAMDVKMIIEGLNSNSGAAKSK